MISFPSKKAEGEPYRVAQRAASSSAQALCLARCRLPAGGLCHLGHHLLRDQGGDRRRPALLSGRNSLRGGGRTIAWLAGPSRPPDAGGETMAGGRSRWVFPRRSFGHGRGGRPKLGGAPPPPLACQRHRPRPPPFVPRVYPTAP